MYGNNSAIIARDRAYLELYRQAQALDPASEITWSWTCVREFTPDRRLQVSEFQLDPLLTSTGGQFELWEIPRYDPAV